MNAQSMLPTEYNLLELYRQHRDEIDAITDATSLFILAFANHSGNASVQSLAQDVRLPTQTLQTKLEPLLRGQMMLQSGNTLSVTPLGKHVLDELGFLTPPIVPPNESPKPPEPSPHITPKLGGTPLWLKGLISLLGIAVVVLIGTLAIVLMPIFTPTPVPIPEMVVEFRADRTTILSGECAQLNWHVERAQWVEVNGQRVNPSGSMQVCPKATTNYVLVVGGGVGDVHSVTIHVESPAPTQVQIVLVAEPLTIKRGECAVIKWEVQGGFGVKLDGAIVSWADGMRVCPAQTTTYRLEVDAGTEIKSQSITINVEPVTPTRTPTFTPTPFGRQIVTITPTFTPTRTRTPTPTPTPPDRTPPTIKSFGSDPHDRVYYGSYCGSYSTNLRVWVSQVTDSSPIDSVNVFYRYISDNKSIPPSNWQVFKMTLLPDGSYSFTINVGKEGYDFLKGTWGTIEFYITAVDSAKNETTTPTNKVQVLYCIG
jgi:hypothetical protein